MYVVPSEEDCHLIVEPVLPVKLTVGAALLLHINADVLEMLPGTVNASVCTETISDSAEGQTPLVTTAL